MMWASKAVCGSWRGVGGAIEFLWWWSPVVFWQASKTWRGCEVRVVVSRRAAIMPSSSKPTYPNTCARAAHI